MKKLIFIFIFILLIPSRVFADYILEPANCTLKKQNNCGAYLYNNKTGATYFCTLEKCNEIMPALEEFAVLKKPKVQKNLKNQKFQNLRKKRKRNLKSQNLRKNLNNLV